MNYETRKRTERLFSEYYNLRSRLSQTMDREERRLIWSKINVITPQLGAAGG